MWDIEITVYKVYAFIFVKIYLFIKGKKDL